MKLKDALASTIQKQKNDRVVRECSVLVAHIRRHPKTTRKAMAEACGIDMRTLNNRIAVLKEKGILSIEKKYVITGKIE